MKPYKIVLDEGMHRSISKLLIAAKLPHSYEDRAKANHIASLIFLLRALKLESIVNDNK